MFSSYEVKKDPEDHDKDGDGVLDPNLPKQEAQDKFNRGVYGEWHFEDLWNTRHGELPGMSKYWEDLEPGSEDPRNKEDSKFKDDAKKESDKAKLKIFEKGGLMNVSNEDQKPEGDAEEGLV